MKIKKSLRLVSVLLSVLMLMSVFTIVSVSAEGEVYSLSLACNLKAAGFNLNNTEAAVQNGIKENFIVENQGCVVNKDNVNLVYQSESSWLFIQEAGKKIQSNLRYAIRCRVELTDNCVWNDAFMTGQFDSSRSYAEFKDGTKNMEGEEYKTIENENIVYEVRTNSVWLIIPLYGNMILSGTDGGCRWSYDESNYALTVSGTVIPDYQNGMEENNPAPWCRLDIRNIKLNEGITKIGDDAFERTNIQSFTAPNSLKTIGKASFNACGLLASVDLKNVETLDYASFGMCDKLKKVTMNKVKTMGYGTFGYDKSLTEITVPATCKTAIGSFVETPIKKIAVLNKNCVLTGSVVVSTAVNTTTYKMYDNAIDKKAVIYCYSGSTAYKYAKTYKRSYNLLGVKITATSATLNAGGEKVIKVTGAKVTSWKTSNSAVAKAMTASATKAAQCTVYGFKKGTAAITAALEDGTKIKIKVTVKTNPRLSKTNVTVKRAVL